MASFETVSDVEAWASQHGGVDAVNEALSTGAFGSNPHTIRTAIRYVEREEHRIAQRREREQRRERAISEAERAAQAAELSARQALVSRWISIVCAVIAVAAVAYMTQIKLG